MHLIPLMLILTVTPGLTQNFGTQGNANSSTANSVIVSGQTNRIESGMRGAFIGAGRRNTLTSGADYSVIVGGEQNFDAGSTNTQFSFIGSGFQNDIGREVRLSFIGVGYSPWLLSTPPRYIDATINKRYAFCKDQPQA